MQCVEWIIPLSLYPHDLQDPKTAVSTHLSTFKNRVVPELKGILVKFHIDQMSIVPSAGCLTGKGGESKGLILLHPELSFIRTTVSIPVDIFKPVMGSVLEVKVTAEKPTYFISKFGGYRNLTVILNKIGESACVESVDGSSVELEIGKYMQAQVTLVDIKYRNVYIQAKFMRFIEPSQEMLKQEAIQLKEREEKNKKSNLDKASKRSLKQESNLSQLSSGEKPVQGTPCKKVKPNPIESMMEEEAPSYDWQFTQKAPEPSPIKTPHKKKVKLEESIEPSYQWSFTQENKSKMSRNEAFFESMSCTNSACPPSPDLFSSDDD
ncbi:hypothetical protein Ciccas_001614 [Cichlidogyrus casuarinus]|uniref:Uncharacterized protein n=1 Tax=Cichlidogyrus casuarinus TaxID=1844966 RepID=A0ABD2QK33_9PLAT